MTREEIQALKEKKELSGHDKHRLMRCVKCEKNPEFCGCTEKDEDNEGMCKKYREAEIWK